MNKDIIPQDQALALKELGFKEYSEYYTDQGSVVGITWRQAFTWFRQKHKLIANVSYRTDVMSKIYGVKNKYFFTLLNQIDPGDIDINRPSFSTYEEAELACLKTMIEKVDSKDEVYN